MVKPVSGFVTAQGEFFESKEHAELAEAKQVLITEMEQHGISVETLDWIDTLYESLLDYLEAMENVRKPKAKVSNPAKSS